MPEQPAALPSSAAEEQAGIVQHQVQAEVGATPVVLKRQLHDRRACRRSGLTATSPWRGRRATHAVHCLGRPYARSLTCSEMSGICWGCAIPHCLSAGSARPRRALARTTRVLQPKCAGRHSSGSGNAGQDKGQPFEACDVMGVLWPPASRKRLAGRGLQQAGQMGIGPGIPILRSARRGPLGARTALLEHSTPFQVRCAGLERSSRLTVRGRQRGEGEGEGGQNVPRREKQLSTQLSTQVR